ncbi:MAG TPA: ABC transporter permease, partial [Roseiarcus sp.]
MNDAAPARVSAAPPAAWRRIDLFAIAVRFQSVIGLILVAIGGIIFSPRRHGLILFLAPDNMANIVRAVSETGIIAGGMTFVIITAGIDLSVGALLSLSSVLTATIMTSAGWGLIPTILFVVACGAAFGAVQGLISTRFRLEPFIVTLAGLQVARGLALVISGNQYINISYGEGPGLAPPVFAILGDRLFNNIVPVATLVFVVVAAIATFVLNFTRFGRYVFAVGGNERAARLSGVPVTAVKISVYAITGLVSAIAGIVHAGQFN